MRHYIQINRYMVGDSLAMQLTKIMDKGLFDENLAVFFSKSNCITTEDIAYMIRFFEIATDSDFNKDNVIFIPKDWVLRKVEKKTMKF